MIRAVVDAMRTKFVRVHSPSLNSSEEELLFVRYMPVSSHFEQDDELLGATQSGLSQTYSEQKEKSSRDYSWKNGAGEQASDSDAAVLESIP